MVFHEIDSITDVISGHRIIFYFVERQSYSSVIQKNLCEYVKEALEKLEKKNDDLLIIKICHDSYQFNQFQELYKPEISGLVTVFVVNNEGIPILSKHIEEESNISAILETLCSICNLNCVPSHEFSKFLTVRKLDFSNGPLKQIPPLIEDKTNSSLQKTCQNSQLTSETEVANGKTCTEIQIRLPDGSRDIKTFDKNAMLQEVYVFINTKHNLKDFHLKTYNHQIFCEEDYERSLGELDLYPNGVIIVVSSTVSTSHAGGITGSVHHYFWQLFGKTTSVLRYVQGLLFMFWNSLFFPNNNGGTTDQTNGNMPNSDRTNSHRKNNKSSLKWRGSNVHTLQRNDDSDDENNRYNGNSTQQK